ncbi:hypothetical protein [Endozoicomonas arenosclerae]|uniref:hypothetical protein n=1 Tax=Endozoicomonas arenosclerae TaxID=1633495 RepID=UPI000A8ABFC7|nr:hypothetical protein [Endozoicomonas arenosclerae]
MFKELFSSFALAGGILLSASCSVQADGSDQDPGQDNPVRNPDNLTIFNVDDIGLITATNSASSSVLLDFYAQDSKLNVWSQQGQQLKSTDICNTTPNRRLTSGRISSPLFEQAVCSTAFGVSLYTGFGAIGNGDFLAYNFSDPGPEGNARNFDAAAGLMDRASFKNGMIHMELVVARKNLNDHLTVDVLGYKPAKKGSPAALVSLASWVDSSDTKVTGDVSLALGDYDNDSQLDILVAADATTGVGGKGKVLLKSFQYKPRKQTLKLADAEQLTTAARPRSLELVSGDFGSLGSDQAMLAYYPDQEGAQINLSYFVLAKKLKIDPAQIKAKLTGKPAHGSFFDMAAGLFHFDPAQTQGSNMPFAFHTRQLAITWAGSDKKVRTQIVMPSQELTQFIISQEKTVSSKSHVSRTDGVGPTIAAGNFIGLHDDAVSPLDQIAVAIPTLSEGSPTASIPELVVAKVEYSKQTAGFFKVTPVWDDRQPLYEMSGLEYGLPLVALDSQGKSFYLGNPAHIRVQDLIDPQYVIYMPPRHVDCIPPEGGGDCEIINISGDTMFYVELIDSKEQTLQQTSTDQMSSEFGSSASFSVSETVGGDVMEIAKAEVTSTQKTAFSYEHGTMERSVNTSYQSILTQRSASTTVDDHLIWNARLIDIWRYPVYGLDLGEKKQYPYYDVLIPGVMQQFSAAGRSVDWFNPRHINNNALSYPLISDPEFPSDLGSFEFTTEQGKTKVTKPLNAGVVRTFDGNMQTFELNYTEESGGSVEKTYNYNLSNTTDVSIGFTASADIEFVEGSVETEGSVSLDSKSSWENSSLSERTMKQSKGITLNQPEVDGIFDKSYNYKTLIYISKGGGIKVAHAVDPLGSNSGKAWWQSTYGGAADPAVNLPNRLKYSQMDADWELNPGESYHWMRGVALTSATYDDSIKSYPYLTGGATQGDKIRVVAKAYNLSLDTSATQVKVHFAYQTYDPSTKEPVGKPVHFATSNPINLPAQAVKEVVAVWDTTGLAGSEFTPYRFVISVESTGSGGDLFSGNQQKGGNNKGIWPWGGSYFYIFKDKTGAATASLAAQSYPSVALKVLKNSQPENAESHVVHVSIQSDDHDASLRHLIIAGNKSEDGIQEVLATRTLWGIHKGQQILKVPVDLSQSPHTSLKAILSTGTDAGKRQGKPQVHSEAVKVQK